MLPFVAEANKLLIPWSSISFGQQYFGTSGLGMMCRCLRGAVTDHFRHSLTESRFFFRSYSIMSLHTPLWQLSVNCAFEISVYYLPCLNFTVCGTGESAERGYWRSRKRRTVCGCRAMSDLEKYQTIKQNKRWQPRINIVRDSVTVSDCVRIRGRPNFVLFLFFGAGKRNFFIFRPK